MWFTFYSRHLIWWGLRWWINKLINCGKEHFSHCWPVAGLYNRKHCRPTQFSEIQVAVSQPYMGAANVSRDRTVLCKPFRPVFGHSNLLKPSYDQLFRCEKVPRLLLQRWHRNACTFSEGGKHFNRQTDQHKTSTSLPQLRIQHKKGLDLCPSVNMQQWVIVTLVASSWDSRVPDSSTIHDLTPTETDIRKEAA